MAGRGGARGGERGGVRSGEAGQGEGEEVGRGCCTASRVSRMFKLGASAVEEVNLEPRRQKAGPLLLGFVLSPPPPLGECLLQHRVKLQWLS